MTPFCLCSILSQDLNLIMVCEDQRSLPVTAPLGLAPSSIFKEKFQNVVKSRIIDHLEVLLRAESSSLTSSPYFKAQYMSLMHPHPLLSSCGSKPFEVHKAVTVARMLSGRYLTDKLQRHRTVNRDGYASSQTASLSLKAP